MKRSTRERIRKVTPRAYDGLRTFVHHARMSFEPPAMPLADIFARTFGAPQVAGLTFAQIGANVGHDQYDALGKFDWRGVFVEPQPQVFSKLRVNAAANPNLACENAAIGLTPGTMPLYICPLSDNWWATGMASLRPETLKRQFLDGWIQDRCREEGLPIPATADACIQRLDIQVITWADLRNRHGLQNLDVLLVDVEGFDDKIVASVLDSGDRPRFIAFEHQHLSTTRRWRIRRKLREAGYTCFAVLGFEDTVAVRNGTS